MEKHPEVDVPNLQVLKLMQSFTSQELVTERFAWRHYYWCELRANSGHGTAAMSAGAKLSSQKFHPDAPPLAAGS